MIDCDYIECGECSKLMGQIPSNSIDLIVTSPPYDNLRSYNGYTFEFENIANELYRVVKKAALLCGSLWIPPKTAQKV